jgi:CBS domain containing-hemolysin-like protein
MGPVELTLRLVAGALLTLANAFFVVTEFSLTRAPQFEEEEFQETKGMRQAWEMTQELEIYLTGCQLGITSASILLGVVAEPAVSALLEPVLALFGIGGATLTTVSVVVAIIIINLIHKIWGEQAPTYLGVERPRQVATYLAPGLYWWTRIMKPVIYLGDGLAKSTLGLFGVEVSRSWTEEEEEGVEGEDEAEGPLTSHHAVRRQVGRVLSRGDLSRERRVEVLRTLEIEEMPVREIMVARGEMTVLHADSSLEENLHRMRSHPHDRYPLVGDGPDDVHGAVYTPAVFRDLEALQSGETTLAEVAAPPVTVPAKLPVSELIDRFQQEGQELAFVVEDEMDAAGGTRVVGLVTITDAFEAIAGELEDPVDEERAEDSVEHD